jgi:hypothetical protein
VELPPRDAKVVFKTFPNGGPTATMMMVVMIMLMMIMLIMIMLLMIMIMMMIMMMMIPTAGTAMAQPALVVSIRASADAPAVVLSDITWPLELCALTDDGG